MTKENGSFNQNDRMRIFRNYWDFLFKNNKYTIEVDGRKSGASFSVHNKRIVYVAIKCSGLVEPGKQYVQVRGGGPLVTHVYFTHHLNPLLVGITWIAIFLVIVVLLWYILLRRIIYPQFGNCQKTIIIHNQSPIILKMKGKRMIVISK